jgi:hypothetical protein
MKRWKIILGRGGTVLISIGLALLLASFIPSAQLGTVGGSGRIPPEFFFDMFERVLTPQQGLEVTINASGTLNVYILEVGTQTIHDWISEHYSEQEPPFYDYNNVTSLEEFLKGNPDSIGRQKEMREGKIEYIPTKVTNATLLFSNPSSEAVIYDFTVSIRAIVAPGAKVRNLAQWVIPIGFVLALPGIAQLWKEKTTHQRDNNVIKFIDTPFVF